MLALVTMMLLGAPDAGVPFMKAFDGGVARASVSDGGVEPLAEVVELKAQVAGRAGETEALKKRVTELEARAAELERQLKTTTSDLTRKLERTADDLAAFKREVNEREDERREAERKQAEAKARVEASTKSLVAADQQLASGSAAGVAEALRAADGTYPGAAGQYLQLARAALSNNDLATARRYIMAAVLELQFSR